MNNKTKLISISIDESSIETLEKLDTLLSDLGISRSSFFRNSAVKFIKKYESIAA